jgi:hypothetical protein
MKKVQDLLIGNTYTVLESSTNAKIPLSNAGANGGVGATSASLTAGQLAIVDPLNDLKDAGATSPVVQIAQYDSKNSFRLSLPIHRDQVSTIVKRGFVAPAYRQVKITPGTLVAGKRYAVILEETSEEDFVPISRRFEVIAPTTVAADTIDKFVALINADAGASQIVVASKTDANAKLAITSIYAVTQFNLGWEVESSTGEMVATQSAVAVVTAGTIGSGTAAIISELESIYKGYQGHLNRIHLPDDVVNYSDPSKTYVVYTIEHKRPLESNNDNDVKGIPVVTTVAIDSAGAADFETALETVFNVTL